MIDVEILFITEFSCQVFTASKLTAGLQQLNVTVRPLGFELFRCELLQMLVPRLCHWWMSRGRTLAVHCVRESISFCIKYMYAYASLISQWNKDTIDKLQDSQKMPQIKRKKQFKLKLVDQRVHLLKKLSHGNNNVLKEHVLLFYVKTIFVLTKVWHETKKGKRPTLWNIVSCIRLQIYRNKRNIRYKE